MYKKYLLSLSLGLALIISGCSKDKKESTSSEIISKKEYLLSGLDSKEYLIKQIDNGFVLDSAKDKIVIFDIFATWCPPCRATASHLSALQQKYKNDVIIIGVTIEDNIENAKLQEFADKYNAKYTLVNSAQNKNLIYDIVKELKVGAKYPIPLMAVYKDAKLVNYYAGAAQEEFIESDIKRALGKK